VLGAGVTAGDGIGVVRAGVTGAVDGGAGVTAGFVCAAALKRRPSEAAMIKLKLFRVFIRELA